MEKEIAHLAAACSLRAFPYLVFASPYLDLGRVDAAAPDAAAEPPKPDSAEASIAADITLAQTTELVPLSVPEVPTEREAVQVRHPAASRHALAPAQQGYAMLHEVRSALATRANSPFVRRA